MTKRNLLLASLLLLLGLGIMAPVASAQAPALGNATVFNVSPVLYTMRPNSIGDAGGQIFIQMASGLGTVAGGESFSITFSKPIVGAAGLGSAPVSDFCSDGTTALTGGASGPGFCENLSFSASGTVLTFVNTSATALTGWTAGEYVVISGIRFDTVGVPPGTFVTATVGAVLNDTYPLYFGLVGETATQTPVNVAQVATTSAGGTVYESFGTTGYGDSVVTCFNATTSYFVINIAEQWAGAWTSLSDEQALALYAPTGTRQVTNGSIMSITLTGIPLGVTVAPFGAPALTPATGFAFGAPSPTQYIGAKANDSVTFEFPLLFTDLSANESAYFTFVVTTPGPIPLQSPPMVATVYLNPQTPTTSVAYPAFTYPENGLASEPSPLPVVDFIGCETSLLFPYVTNYTNGSSALGNWDTGIVVANTSSDPFQYSEFSTSDSGPNILLGAIATAGTCTFSVYDAAPSAGAISSPLQATPITFTRPAVASGGVDSFLLSQTAAKGLPAGYAIAVCNFLNGTGYALIADNANGLGNWGVMGNYLAYVIPNPAVEPRWLDSIFGEFAISPWAYYFTSGLPIGAHKPAGLSIGSKLRSPILQK